MRKAIEATKNLIAQTLLVTGVLRIALYLRFRRHAAILMYHRVLPENGGIDSFSTDAILVTPEEFDWQMQLLHRYMRPAGIESLLAMLDPLDPTHPSMACFVTFDDGWYDNHDYALPILEQRKTPATVFVCTGYIGTRQCFWQEALARILHRAWQDPRLGERVLPLFGADDLAAAAPADAKRLGREVVNALKARPSDEIAALLQRARSICSECGIDPSEVGDDRFMAWDEVRRLARAELVAVESHAVTHTPLDRLSETAQLEELEGARRRIEDATGHTVTAIAYPNGDFDPVVVESARRAGYRIAVTTLEGRVGKGDNPLTLRRINVHKAAARTPARFLCRIAGIF